MSGGMLAINLREQLAMAVSGAHFAIVSANQGRGSWCRREPRVGVVSKFLDHRITEGLPSYNARLHHTLLL